MTQSLRNWLLDSRSDNRKSKTCPFDKLWASSAQSRRIQNLY
jgi:hypothetical protein